MSFNKYVINDGFGLGNLKMVEQAMPILGPGQVLVKIHDISLNSRDLKVVEGILNPNLALPLVPCSDGVGVVEAIGDGVSRFRPGDRVCITFFENWIDGDPTDEAIGRTRGGPVDGTLAQYTMVDQQGLVLAPGNLTDVECATLPCAGLTAWSATMGKARLRPGDWVLVLGTGGVSTFALQFAKLAGAKVVVTSSDNEKLKKATALGADFTINYRETADWGKKAKEVTKGRGVDLVVEVGGAMTLNQSLQAIRPGGQISLIGVLSGPVAQVNLGLIFRAGIKVQGIFVGSRASFETMNKAVIAHDLHPFVDKVFPFEKAPEAFEYFKTQRHQGKVVIQMS